MREFSVTVVKATRDAGLSARSADLLYSVFLEGESTPLQDRRTAKMAKELCSAGFLGGVGHRLRALPKAQVVFDAMRAEQALGMPSGVLAGLIVPAEAIREATMDIVAAVLACINHVPGFDFKSVMSSRSAFLLRCARGDPQVAAGTYFEKLALVAYEERGQVAPLDPWNGSLPGFREAIQMYCAWTWYCSSSYGAGSYYRILPLWHWVYERRQTPEFAQAWERMVTPHDLPVPDVEDHPPHGLDISCEQVSGLVRKASVLH